MTALWECYSRKRLLESKQCYSYIYPPRHVSDIPLWLRVWGGGGKLERAGLPSFLQNGSPGVVFKYPLSRATLSGF